MMYGGGDVMEIGDTQTACNEACATLQNLNRLELQKLEDDNEALQSLIDDMAIVKRLERDKESLMVSNASLAEYNLSLEPKLISGRQELADVYKKAIDLQKQHERNLLRLDTCAVNTSPETTLALLQTELAKAEEEAEKLTEKFSSGGSGHGADVESFVNEYVSLRSVAHLRRVKVDKLTEILREGQHQQRDTSINMAGLAATVPPIPSRTAPPRPNYVNCAPPPPVAAGWPQAMPYPPIGASTASNGWMPNYGAAAAPQYAAVGPHPVSYM